MESIPDITRRIIEHIEWNGVYSVNTERVITEILEKFESEIRKDQDNIVLGVLKNDR